MERTIRGNFLTVRPDGGRVVLIVTTQHGPERISLYGLEAIELGLQLVTAGRSAESSSRANQYAAPPDAPPASATATTEPATSGETAPGTPTTPTPDPHPGA